MESDAYKPLSSYTPTPSAASGSWSGDVSPGASYGGPDYDHFGDPSHDSAGGSPEPVEEVPPHPFFPVISPFGSFTLSTSYVIDVRNGSLHEVFGAGEAIIGETWYLEIVTQPGGDIISVNLIKDALLKFEFVEGDAVTNPVEGVYYIEAFSFVDDDSGNPEPLSILHENVQWHPRDIVDVSSGVGVLRAYDGAYGIRGIIGEALPEEGEEGYVAGATGINTSTEVAGGDIKVTAAPVGATGTMTWESECSGALQSLGTLEVENGLIKSITTQDFLLGECNGGYDPGIGYDDTKFYLKTILICESGVETPIQVLTLIEP